MATVLRMPGVSADANEAELMEWAVGVGDRVTRGDVVATVETEKAVVDLEAEEDGVLLKVFADAGQTVPIGGPIAVFLQDGEEASEEEAILAALGLGPQASGPLTGSDEERSQDHLVPGATHGIEHTSDEVVDQGNGHGLDADQRIFATPLVRRLAAQAGVPLEEMKGTGPNGRIRRADFEAALERRAAAGAPATAPTAGESPAPEPASSTPSVPQAPARPQAEPSEFTDVPHTRFRRAVASALTASKQTVPHFYLKATCQVADLLELRAQVNDGGSAKITINDFFVKAAALAMVRVPDMNVVWTDDAVRRFSSVDIAVAMASERGLMTPVVRSVESRSLSDVSGTIKNLAARAGAGELKQHELEGGSLAVSNLGMFGVEEFAAIINPPQVGILAVGAVVPHPIATKKVGVEWVPCVKVVLSVDHRPVDGALAAQWLREFKQLIENPFQILV